MDIFLIDVHCSCCYVYTMRALRDPHITCLPDKQQEPVCKRSYKNQGGKEERESGLACLLACLLAGWLDCKQIRKSEKKMFEMQICGKET